MTEDFVPFELAKKLKEKGFEMPTNMIFAMYNQLGIFHPLTTSADYSVCDSGFKFRCYYDFDDFDENDYVAPTISQVLKWLREEKKIHIHSRYSFANYKWWWNISMLEKHNLEYSDAEYQSHEAAVLAGIECALGELP